MTIRSGPMVPSWGVIVAMLVDLGLMGFALFRNNWIGLVVLALVLMFILGADTTAMIRAWRGTPEPRPDPEPAPEAGP